MTKKVKVWLIISAFWFIINIASYMNHESDLSAFIQYGMLPLVIGWSVYVIRQK